MARGFGSTLGVGTTDKVVSPVTVGVASDFTLAIAANRNGNGGGGFGYLWVVQSSGFSLLFWDSSSGLFRFQRARATTAADYRITSGAASAGTWYRMMITMSGTAAPVWYIDGSSMSLTTVSAGSGAVVTTAVTRTIGNRSTDSARNFDGLLADYALWSSVLNAGDIAAYAAGVSPLALQPGSLIDHNPLLGGAGRNRMLGAETVTGTAKATHPLIIMPRRRTRVYSFPAAAPTGFQAAWAARSTVTIQPGVAA